MSIVLELEENYFAFIEIIFQNLLQKFETGLK